MKMKYSLIAFLLVFSAQSYAAVAVCGRGYIKNVVINQASIMSGSNKDRRNVAISLDTTGFKTSDFPASSNYWQGNFITAELLWPAVNVAHYNDWLYPAFLNTVLHAQQARLPVKITVDPVPANSSGSVCRVGIADYNIMVCTSEAECNN